MSVELEPGPSRNTSPGVTPAELAEVVARRSANPITPAQLKNWLVGAGFADLDHGLLRPTRAALEIAGALRQLEGA